MLRIRRCPLNDVSFYRNVNIFYKPIAYYVLGDVYLTMLVSIEMLIFFINQSHITY